MTYQKPFVSRPWIKNTMYELLSRPFVLHYDLFAYKPLLGDVFFVLEARQGGHALKARSIYRWDNETLADVSTVLNQAPVEQFGEPLTWNERSARIFNACHKPILAQCVLIPPYTRKSVLCHYVRVLDENPFPRTMVNRWRYGSQRAPQH